MENWCVVKLLHFLLENGNEGSPIPIYQEKTKRRNKSKPERERERQIVLCWSSLLHAFHEHQALYIVLQRDERLISSSFRFLNLRHYPRSLSSSILLLFLSLVIILILNVAVSFCFSVHQTLNLSLLLSSVFMAFFSLFCDSWLS